MPNRERTIDELEELMPMLARWGVRKAYRETMAMAGYVIEVDGGYLVKVYQDGRHERLKKLPERLKVKAGQRVVIS
ncbi:MAG: hypothetical protein DWI24_06985 [Planctomycetota bacterium]|nr:MAG: hypothetical protein DWI24_06985 [Planctomycetota bacterium]